MAIDFPNSPSVNDTFSADERTWQWDGTAWRLLTGLAVLSSIDIVNGTEIGAAIVDADDFPIYDVSASVNRKTDASRISTYVFSKTSGDVTIDSSGVATIAANSVALGTDTTGNYVATITAGTGVSSTGATTGEGIAHTLSIGQAVATNSDVEFAGLKIATVREPVLVSATAMSATTVNIDAKTNPTVYYTANATANGTVNIRSTSSESLNTLLSVGDMITATFMVTNGGTAYRPTTFQVDGSSVTPKWQGGSAPSAGNASSVDAYTMTVLKTANATFTMFAAQTRFA